MVVSFLFSNLLSYILVISSNIVVGAFASVPTLVSGVISLKTVSVNTHTVVHSPKYGIQSWLRHLLHGAHYHWTAHLILRVSTGLYLTYLLVFLSIFWSEANTTLRSVVVVTLDGRQLSTLDSLPSLALLQRANGQAYLSARSFWADIFVTYSGLSLTMWIWSSTGSSSKGISNSPFSYPTIALTGPGTSV